jgi:hypothetical protein
VQRQGCGERSVGHAHQTHVKANSKQTARSAVTAVRSTPEAAHDIMPKQQMTSL